MWRRGSSLGDTVVMAGIHRIDAVTLTTADMAASVAFYTALGLHISFGGPESDFTTMSASDNGAHINLIRVATPDDVATGWGRTIIHVDDVDAMHDQMVAAGWPPDAPPSDASWGERYFPIHDPAGHDLSIARPLTTD